MKPSIHQFFRVMVLIPKLDAKLLVIALVTLTWHLCLHMAAANGQSPTDSPQVEIDPQFVPDDASALLFVRVPSSTDGSFGDWFPIEVIEAAGQKYLGFNPLKLESALLVVEKLDVTRPPAVGVVLRFHEDTQLKLDGVERLEENGKIYYRGMPGGMSAIEVNSRTILWGAENYLGVMLDANGAGNPLLQLSKTHPPTAFTNLYFDLASNREFLLSFTKDIATDTPPELKFLLQLPELVDQMVVRQQLSADLEVDLRLIAGDAEKATKTAEILQAALSTAQLALLPAAKSALDVDDPVQAAVYQYVQRVSARLLQDLQPVVRDRELSIRAKLPVQLANNGVLLGLLLPAIQQTREAARRVNAMNNLRQLALAIQNYHLQHGHLPLGIRDSVGRPFLSWRVEVLPFMGEEVLYREFRLDESWDSEHNAKLIARMPKVFESDGQPEAGTTRYQAVAGDKQLFCGRIIGFPDIVDGTAATAMLVETNAQSVTIWTRPYDIQIDPSNPLLAVAGARSNNGFLAVMADGSCHTINDSIDPVIWWGTTTFADRDGNLFQNLKE
ncbi:MAG: DUF1559 domain-containing protein [Pirellulaceae bacterium]